MENSSNMDRKSQATRFTNILIETIMNFSHHVNHSRIQTHLLSHPEIYSFPER